MRSPTHIVSLVTALVLTLPGCGPVTITARAGKVEGSAAITIGAGLADLHLVISEIREPVPKRCGAGPSYSPNLSPDGQRFTLTHGDCEGNQHPLAIANADGSGLTLVGPRGGAPKWSPLGDRLVQLRNGNVQAVDTDGSGVMQVTSTGTAGLASYSPDGSRLVYHDLVEGRQRLRVMNADGSGV